MDTNPSSQHSDTSTQADHDFGIESDCPSTQSNPEAAKIQPNSLYLTFNAPRVDDYHRGIFLTHPPAPQPSSETQYSGTLFHASYISPSPSPTSPTTSQAEPQWVLERRHVKDVSSAHSLVLLYRLATLSPTPTASIQSQIENITRILSAVPLGRCNRETCLGKLGEKEGNAKLGGYDCVIWTRDAVSALAREGIIELGGQAVESIMNESRALAGPEDARTMVGVDFGGFRVAN